MSADAAPSRATAVTAEKPAPAKAAGHVDSLLSPDAALLQILKYCQPLEPEVVELSAALGRVLAEPVSAGRVLPPWDNSAMDGYAVRAEEVQIGQPLPVAFVVPAGRADSLTLPPGTAARIMTGAPLPSGADAVLMKEDADEKDGAVCFRVRASVGQHIRRAGEDLQLGSEALAAGAVLGAGELGLLAALGRTLVLVHRRPIVAIVSTGDELVPADRTPGPGQIVNSNAHALLAQVTQAGAVGRVLPTVADDPVALRRTFRQALQADVVISSGGVSVGEFDYVTQVLAELGAEPRFSKVAMKPGKPLQFLTLPVLGAGSDPAAPRQVLWLGLPGNPASSMVSFELFVRPALRRLLGFAGAQLRRPLAAVRLATSVIPDRTRVHFARARVQRPAENPAELWATPKAAQGSGLLGSMVGVQGLLHIPAGLVPLTAGSTVLCSLLEPV